ncbi:uncharacterized protein LOC126894907 isoform X3 [Daktulosphaira vitifoliae]|uniref:uncharacterized protein LOC126894907 isoform X3 n=1 Tax=Daktulosphaira vitifoliae TaxID=58002 RepID=UPI0021A9CC18|nr:uncharacterized protein LOC126894907 isoform X3 [Daktulosphaira vitifoliae]
MNEFILLVKRSTYYYILQFKYSVIQGLICSTSAVYKQVKYIDKWSVKNLEKAQRAFYNCTANLNINEYIYKKKDTFDGFLDKLRGDMIIGRMKNPIEMSTKILEYLSFDTAPPFALGWRSPVSLSISAVQLLI